MLRLLIVSYYQTSVENQTTVRSFNLTRIKGDLVMKLLNNAVIRLTKNRKPAYDPENELMWDRTYNSSSWFVIGHFEAEGHKLNYLYHHILIAALGVILEWLAQANQSIGVQLHKLPSRNYDFDQLWMKLFLNPVMSIC